MKIEDGDDFVTYFLMGAQGNVRSLLKHIDDPEVIRAFPEYLEFLREVKKDVDLICKKVGAYYEH